MWGGDSPGVSGVNTRGDGRTGDGVSSSFFTSASLCYLLEGYIAIQTATTRFLMSGKAPKRGSG